jgi:biofilm PGA synthesis N-glycosyltransferase PgaC
MRPWANGFRFFVGVVAWSLGRRNSDFPVKYFYFMSETMESGYVLVTPVRNEERTIEITIKSVLAQTVMPREWVIVSDQSTDQTDAIVGRYVQEFPWLRLVPLKDRPSRNFASVVFVTELGISALQTRDYAYLGLLDGDVSLPADYYALIMKYFTADPKLGLAGGLVEDVVNGKRLRNRQSLQDVAGAVQFFRRDCFKLLGGLVPLPEGGWDAITCVRARMNGFRTATFPDMVVDHLKPRNSAEGNLFRRNWQFGIRDYALGNHPLFEMAKGCARCLDFPPVIGSLFRLLGFGWAIASRRQRSLPADVVRYIRHEQLARLMPFSRR